MTHHFCTLFDRHYATRGVALLRSLEQHCREEFRFTILCMDQETQALLARLNRPRTELILPGDLGDTGLLAAEHSRPRREFCWTCPPSLMLAMLNGLPPGEIATYVDADLAFFSDLAPVYEELGDKDIATHILRTQLLAAGQTLSAATAELCRRWAPGVTLLPMTDDPVRTHVTVRLDGSKVIGNGVGVTALSGGALLSAGNNIVEANGSNGAFSGSIAFK